MGRAKGISQKRVSEKLYLSIASLINNGMNDRRLQLVTVTHVTVDKELEHANIWVCAPSLGEDRSEEVLGVLAKASGFIRHELASRLKIRRIPQLHFVWDFTPDRAAQVEQLIDDVISSNEHR
tara:strand:- start:4327 stop:4695 length:369 start_codon:yes stop_codon:yes gene_type:complete